MRRAQSFPLDKESLNPRFASRSTSVSTESCCWKESIRSLTYFSYRCLFSSPLPSSLPEIQIMLSFRSNMFLSVLFGAAAVAHGTLRTYTATLAPLGTNTVSGTVRVVVDDVTGDVYSSGTLQGVTPSVNDVVCNFTNGCGAHIHEGKSCFNVSTQLGHYWNKAAIVTDPWLVTRYSSNALGVGTIASNVNIATSDVIGRAYMAHAPSGARVACGLLQCQLSYFIYNSNTNARVGELTDGWTGCIRSPFNIEVQPCVPPQTTPVYFKLWSPNNYVHRTKEYTAPFFLDGDDTKGDVFKNRKALPNDSYRLYTTIDGVEKYISFTQRC